MTVGDILDGAFRLLVANWRTMLIVAAIIVVPVQLATSFFARELLGGSFLVMLENPGAIETLDTGSWLGDLITLVWMLLLFPVLTGGLAWVALRSALGEECDWGETLRVMGRRAWPLIASWWLLLLASIAVVAVGGVLLALGAVTENVGLLIVGVLVMMGGGLAALAIATFLALAPAVIVSEQAGPLQALRRSAGLVKRRFWPVLGTILLAGLVTSVVSFALSGVPSFVALLLGDFGWLLAAGGSIVASLVTVPVFAVVLALLYLDARVRHEGLDLEIAATRLGSPGDVGPSW